MYSVTMTPTRGANHKISSCPPDTQQGDLRPNGLHSSGSLGESCNLGRDVQAPRSCSRAAAPSQLSKARGRLPDVRHQGPNRRGVVQEGQQRDTAARGRTRSQQGQDQSRVPALGRLRHGTPKAIPPRRNHREQQIIRVRCPSHSSAGAAQRGADTQQSPQALQLPPAAPAVTAHCRAQTQMPSEQRAPTSHSRGSAGKTCTAREERRGGLQAASWVTQWYQRG